jgi:hypothetical protein
MQFVPFEAGIEVNGQAVYSLVEGFTMFKKIPSDILLSLGVGRPGLDGLVMLREGEWVSQAVWLRAFEQIGVAVGLGALYAIGLKIPECAGFPPRVDDVHTALRSIDVAYHLNHRKAGRVMFDASTGAMLEGIGHYGYEPVPGERRVFTTCTSPYPCDFDKGVVTAMARRFAPKAWVDHHQPTMCRMLGGDRCTYVVEWT